MTFVATGTSPLFFVCGGASRVKNLVKQLFVYWSPTSQSPCYIRVLRDSVFSRLATGHFWLVTLLATFIFQRIFTMEFHATFPFADLIPYARNSRTHNEEQIAQIMASIKEFGFTNPILIGSDNVIIAGHGRLLAAQRLGLTEVPVICLPDLTESSPVVSPKRL